MFFAWIQVCKTDLYIYYAFYFFLFKCYFSLLFLFKEWPLFVLQFVGLVKVTRLVGDEMFFCVSPAFGKLLK